MKARYHHTALTRGYVSVKETNGIIEPYKGKFGKGYVVKRHNPNSKFFCYIDYYIFST